MRKGRAILPQSALPHLLGRGDKMPQAYGPNNSDGLLIWLIFSALASS